METYIKAYPLPSTGDWSRPLDWLPMPTVTSSDDTFVGLYAIFPNGNNFAAFRFTTSTGQYQVDWGDGTVTLHNSNVTAEYEYNYSTYDIGNITLTSRGYKQAIIKVTAVSGLLRTCDFNIRYTGQTVQYSTGFLDCILSMPNANSGASIVFGGTNIAHRYCERFDVKTIGGCTSIANMFSGCSSLQSVPLFNTDNITTFLNIFFNCYSLKSVPLFNTSNVTTMRYAFRNCYSLKSIPLFNTSNVTSLEGTFLFCHSLESVPLFNTGNVITMLETFYSCTKLQSIPLFNTSNVTNMISMFELCTNLQSIPALSTTSITISSGSDFTVFAQNANSLDRCQMSFARNVGFQNCQLSRTALEEIFTNLISRTATSATITITGNYGADTAVSRTFTITNGSTTITTADTSSLVAGMQVTGTGSPLTSPVAVTFQDAGDTVTLLSHGLENGDEVSFATVVSTTGIALNTIYYIINKTTDTFQLATSVGGSAIPLTTDGSGTMRHRTEIVSIVANTSITMSRPMRGTGAQTLAFRLLRTGTALLKNWAVTG